MKEGFTADVGRICCGFTLLLYKCRKPHLIPWHPSRLHRKQWKQSPRSCYRVVNLPAYPSAVLARNPPLTSFQPRNLLYR